MGDPGVREGLSSNADLVCAPGGGCWLIDV